jgi:hypothetical protein
MTIYTIEFQDRTTGQSDYKPLPHGTTEEEAAIATEIAAQESKGEGVYLGFFRSTDGQHGFINPGTGAALVGEDWVCR